MFSSTISLGDILQIVSLVVLLFGGYVHITNKLTKVETKVDIIWEHFTKPNRQVELSGFRKGR